MAVIQFTDDDAGYLAWLTDHPPGYVLNTERNPRADYLKLHRTTCHTISGQPVAGTRWTVLYSKLCSEDRRSSCAGQRRRPGERPIAAGSALAGDPIWAPRQQAHRSAVGAAIPLRPLAPRQLSALALAVAALLWALLAATAAAVPIRDPQVRALRPGFIAGNALAVPAPNAIACGINSQAKLIDAGGATLVRGRRRISDGCQTNDRGEATVVFELRFSSPLAAGRYRIVLRAWQHVLPRGVSAHRRAFSLRLPIDLPAAG